MFFIGGKLVPFVPKNHESINDRIQNITFKSGKTIIHLDAFSLAMTDTSTSYIIKSHKYIFQVQ